MHDFEKSKKRMIINKLLGWGWGCNLPHEPPVATAQEGVCYPENEDAINHKY